MKEQARKTAESVNVCVCVRVSEGRGGTGQYSTPGLLKCQQQGITQSITLLLAGWTGSC